MSLKIAGREQVLAFRLDGHNLADRLLAGSILPAAGACGVQNTPPGSAALALRARLTNLTPVDVDHALTGEKELLQAWSLRAAPHVFPTTEAAVFTRGLLPVDEESIRSFIGGVIPALDQIGIGAEKVVELASHALYETLDGRALTKDELGIELAEWVSNKLDARQLNAWRSPSWYAAGQSLGESVVRFVLPIIALRGLCCHGGRRGNKAYLMRTDQWIGGQVPEMDSEQAQAELARRYLHCYGPSSVEHFAGWAGIGLAQASRVWKLVEAELVQIDFDGRLTWLQERDLERLSSPPAPAGIRLLPPGDPYLNMRDRETLVPDKALHRHLWRASGNPGVVLVDGQLVALWRPRKKGETLLLIVEPFTFLTQNIRSQVESEAESLAQLRGCTTVDVQFKSLNK